MLKFVFTWLKGLFSSKPGTKKRPRRKRPERWVNTTLDAGHSWSDGVWSIKELVDVGKSGLSVLSLTDRATWMHGLGLTNEMLTIPKHIGAFVPDEKAIIHAPKWDAQGFYQLDPRWKIPNYSFIGLDGGRFCHWMFYLCYKIVCLPKGWYATGPGYAYEVTVMFNWKNERESEKDKSPEENYKKQLNTLTYYFTIDPETARMYPAGHWEVISTTLPNPKRRDYVRGEPRWGSRRGNIVHNYIPKISEPWTGDAYTEIDDKDQFTLGSQAAMAVATMQTIETHMVLRVCKKVVEGKDKEVAVNLIIHQELIKRLFKSRDKVEYVMTAGGKRRPILHWVKAHYRLTKRGVSKVKTHLRGVRKFEIDGMRCEIQLPGKHRTALGGWDITVMRDMWVRDKNTFGADDEAWKAIKREWKESGKKIADPDIKDFYIFTNLDKSIKSRLFKPKFYTKKTIERSVAA